MALWRWDETLASIAAKQAHRDQTQVIATSKSLHTLQMHWGVPFYLFLSLYGSLVLGQNEEFHEELTLRPLRDGRLASRFSFTTLLQGATPRDPETLSMEDDGALVSLCDVECLKHSSQRSITRYFPLRWDKYCESTRLLKCI